MKTKARTARSAERRRGWPHELVSMAAIRRFAREIAEKFEPDQIIMFGSYAYGEPNLDSDVDFLVVKAAGSERNLGFRIREAVDRPFPTDIIVRTPHTLRWRLREGDWFLREAVGRGMVLYQSPSAVPLGRTSWCEDGASVNGASNGLGKESPMKKLTKEWVDKAEGDFRAAPVLAGLEPSNHDGACFHCQQAAEKYFKALMQQWGLHVPRTHNLLDLLAVLVAHDQTLASLGRGLKKLSEHAVDIRYPGMTATASDFAAALRLASRIRNAARQRLGFKPELRRRKRPSK